MSFQPVNFSPSDSVGSLSAGLGPALAELQNGFAQGASSLQGLGLPPSGSGDLEAQMAQARKQASSALAEPAAFMAITPFQHGIGTRKGEYAYLTPAQALGTLASRLDDAQVADGDENAELALVVMLVATVSHAAMAQALESFNKVYPIPQLEQVCRRAKALSTLETDKFTIPKAPGFPAWGQMSPQKNTTGQAVAKALGGMLAAGEGAGMGATSPGDLLAAFAQKQTQKLQGKAADLQALADSMVGGNDAWVGFSIHAPGPSLFRYLGKLPVPFDEASKCTSLLCWFGKPDQVAFYRESFGLCRRTLTNAVCLTCPGENAACPF
ncbi:hypothetical protein [Desulfovibrio falkowii]|uniref:hypothetical protein n=1 Tax=Desulfovibrio sp. WGS1351 TaxID=3366814 RepID=UPI00372CE80A